MRTPLTLFGLLVSAPPVAMAQNVLTNPGFEQVLASWTTNNGTTRTGDPAPHSGTRYLMGGANNTAASFTYQRKTLVELGVDAATVDEGRVELHFGGWQAGWNTQRDRGRIELAFLDDDLVAIAGGDTGWFFSNHTWVERSGRAVAYPGTRVVQFGFRAERVDGQNNDGYLDDAFLTVAVLPPCYADCNKAPPRVLDIFDFLCFQNRYDAGDPYACDCDTGTGVGVCDIFDFLCFQNAYDAGCP